ncbi:MAG: hypothetical protein C3F13_09590 [Anaerolineales bacterium]|nr:hypothetical protein [Anaerolineae bacterium]PWB53385.1 MAG: hypothetical protein C3F13_09590 [Anaerolineales bacterium]
MNLDQVCVLRSNELTRILAGCVAIDPLLVLPMLDRLKESAFTDDHARQFILAMKDKLPDLRNADEDQQVAITIGIASNFQFLSDYALWISAITEYEQSISQQVEAAIRELQGLAITRHTLTSLSEWIEAAEEIGAWH